MKANYAVGCTYLNEFAAPVERIHSRAYNRQYIIGHYNTQIRQQDKQ